MIRSLTSASNSVIYVWDAALWLVKRFLNKQLHRHVVSNMALVGDCKSRVPELAC